MKATARIYLQKSQSKRTQDGLCPVKLVVTYNRKRRYYSVKHYLLPENIYMTESDFDRATQKSPRGKYKDIHEDFKKVVRIAEDVIKKMPIFSFDRFERDFLARQIDWDDVYYAFDAHITNLKKENRYGYANSFDDACKSVKTFSNNKRLTFADITPNWLNRYENWLIKEGKSMATAGVYTRALRRLFNIALQEHGVKADYPFRKFKPRTATANKRALTPKQISTIMNYQPPEGKKGRQFARDLFLFSFFANGMNIGDILRLKYKNIQDEEIVFLREKTKNKRSVVKIRVPLIQTLKDIINRWGRKNLSEEVYIFPVLDGSMNEERKKEVIINTRSNLNKRLKRIAKDLKFGHLSTVHARHSYATIMKNSGASTEYIQEMLGHSSVNVTQNYLDSFEANTRKEKAQDLEKSIKSMTG